jgi:hypothetical protein
VWEKKKKNPEVQTCYYLSIVSLSLSLSLSHYEEFLNFFLKLPYLDNRLYVTCHQNCCMIPKLFYCTLSMKFSQIWLSPLVDGLPIYYLLQLPQKFEKKKNTDLVMYVMIGSEFLRNLQLTSSTGHAILYCQCL